jgi:hypothetical protein
MPSGDRDGAWRRCLLCDVKVYRVTGLHYRDHPSADETWVEIQLDHSILVSLSSENRQLTGSMAEHSTISRMNPSYRFPDCTYLSTLVDLILDVRTEIRLCL